eukprot:g4883.t1
MENHSHKKILFILLQFFAFGCCFMNGVEWNCASTSNTGTFTRSTDCTIAGNNHVAVSNTLEIVGTNTDMNHLVTITAANTKRHFYLDHANAKLILRYLKLVGGDVSSYNWPDYHGGSIIIYENGGELNLYSSIVFNNKAKYGGITPYVNNANNKLGVLCDYGCATGSSPIESVSVATSVPQSTFQCQLGWGCSATTNTGNFNRSTNCTISGDAHVFVTNILEIVGTNTDMNHLVTITAATNQRHFYLNNANAKLILRYLKLVATSWSGFGGGIEVCAAVATIYNTAIDNNQASVVYGGGGGMRILDSDVNMTNTIISNNGANDNGGGLYIDRSDVNMTNTIISNNGANDN